MPVGLVYPTQIVRDNLNHPPQQIVIIEDAVRAKDAPKASRLAARHLALVRENLLSISAISDESAE